MNATGYGTVAITADPWLNGHVSDVLLHGLPPLPPVTDEQVRAFNPLESRDDDGRWTEGAGGALKDVLKLAGKIDLDSDEHLVGSSKIDADGGGLRMALTRQDGRSWLRFGAGPEGYGRRDREEGTAAWDGNPSRATLSTADRKRLTGELDAIDDEYGSADPGRQAEIDDRFAEIREQLTTDDQGFNGTAKIDEHGMNRLNAKIRTALAEATEQEKAENQAYTEFEALQASGSTDTARLARLREIARLDSTDPLMFADGVIPGSAWGDIHYQLHLDDVTVGPELAIGVQPKGAPDDWDHGKDWQGQFDAADIRKFLRQLDKYRSA